MRVVRVGLLLLLTMALGAMPLDEGYRWGDIPNGSVTIQTDHLGWAAITVLDSTQKNGFVIATAPWGLQLAVSENGDVKYGINGPCATPVFRYGIAVGCQ